MVKFTIDVVLLVLTTHRLQNDGTFRKLERGDGLEIKEGDKAFMDHYQAEQWIKQNPKLEFDNVKIDNTQVGHSFGSPYLHVRQHRVSKPAKNFFTKEEVAEVLKKGNDEVSNSLVVDYDGNVHLIPFGYGSHTNGYAVRFETFQAGNGYVGPKSKLNHLNGTYQTLMEAWVTHLNTGDEEYRDYMKGDKTIEQLKQEAEELINAMEF